MSTSTVDGRHWATKRFAILRHEPGPGFRRQALVGDDSSSYEEGHRSAVHWDWLFESSRSTLLTWATDPISDVGAASDFNGDYPAVRLPDHRIRYLQFEGELGRGRGQVTRIAEGVYLHSDQNENSFVAELTIHSSSVLQDGAKISVCLQRHHDPRQSKETASLWTLRIE